MMGLRVEINTKNKTYTPINLVNFKLRTIFDSWVKFANDNKHEIALTYWGMGMYFIVMQIFLYMFTGFFSNVLYMPSWIFILIYIFIPNKK